MPNTARDHETSLKVLCGICLIKKADRQMNANQKLAALEIRPGFLDSDYMPSGICTSCRLYLGNSTSRATSGPPPCDYQALLRELECLPPRTRGNLVCMCTVCQRVRAGRPGLVMQEQIETPKLQKKGRPRTASPSVSKIICSSCMGEIKPGFPHPCNRSARRENVDRLLTPKIKEQITSDTLKQKLEASGPQMSLSTSGRSLGITVSTQGGASKDAQDFSISHEALKALQVKRNLSDRAVRDVASTIRDHHGRASVEPNYMTFVEDDIHSMARFFQSHVFDTYEKQDGNVKVTKVPRPGVICTNVPGLIQFVKDKRAQAQDNNYRYKIGLDSGGGSLKVCLNIINHSTRSPTKSPLKKMSKTHSMAGVKKLLLLAIVPQAAESYENVKAILEKLRLSLLDFYVACDLKLTNILLGLQAHSAKHPCYVCEGYSPWGLPLVPRTLGSIKRHVEAFRKAGSKISKAKDHKNCVNMPLLSGNDTDLTIDLVPLPELHLLLGISNRFV